MVDKGYKRAQGIIDKYAAAMVRVAEALLEREVLDGAEVIQLINGESLAAVKNANSQAKGNGSQAQPVKVDPKPGLRVPPLMDGPQPA